MRHLELLLIWTRGILILNRTDYHIGLFATHYAIKLEIIAIYGAFFGYFLSYYNETWNNKLLYCRMKKDKIYILEYCSSDRGIPEL